jgi:ATP phosphoribosyltransferase regulatory subunit
MIRTFEGMRDMLFEECAARRESESSLAELFCRRGFREVSTPVLERYELFCRIGSPLAEETLLKTVGRDGHICVLRPDNTAPIARLAATRLKNELPLKLWYAQPVYRVSDEGCRELFQAGAEAIGDFSDAELLSLAYETAALCFGKPPHIEVSHAGVLQAVFDQMDLDAVQRSRALSLIGRRNFAELGDEFPNAENLLKLVRVSGGTDAVEEAEKLAGRPFSGLRALSGDTVSFDFSLAPPIGYYTGMFFKGYTEGAADAVLTGGRYDNLLGLLGRDLPAVGFAVNME